MQKRLAIIFTLFHLQLFSQQIQYKNYTVEDGLPSSMVYRVVQDKRGFIWFATEAGVCRFDGAKFTTFTTQQGLPDNDVLEIREDSRGRIWFLTLTGVPAYYYQDSIHSFSTHPQYRKLEIKSHLSCFYEDAKGDIWLGTARSGLIKISGNKTFRITDEKLNLTKKSRIFFITSNRKNELLIAMDSHVVNISTGKIMFRDVLNSHGHFPRFCRLNDSCVVFSRHDGLKRFNDTVIASISPEVSFQVKEVIYLGHDKTGQIWSGTAGYGVYALNTAMDSIIARYLPDNFVSSVCRDHEGNLWFSTLTDGVFFLPFNYERFHTYKPEGVTENTFSVRGDHKGRIWSGLNGAVQVIKDGKASVFKLYGKNDTQKLRRVNTITVHPNGTVWCGVENEIIVFRDTVIVKRISFGTKDLAEHGGIVFSCGLGINMLSADYQVESVKYGSINCLAPDNQGTLFIGTNQGLFKMEGNAIKAVEEPAFRSLKITDLQIDRNNVLYAATEGQGLFRLTNGSVTKLTTANGLLSNTCRTIFIDGKNTVWLGSGKGINRVRFTRTGAAITSFTKEDGLPTNEIKGIYVSGDSVWVASSKGLTVFTERKKFPEPSRPYIYIENILVWEKDTTLKDGFTLNHNENNLRFRFKGLSYNSFGNLLYKHKIEGIDKSWVYTTQTNARYTSLPPGNYIFQVSVRNKNGYWSAAPAKIGFTVKKPYWETLGFRISMALLGIGILWLIYYYLLNNLKKKALLEYKLIRSDQKAMRAQMNPHFIFNSLNAIQSYITQGNDTAAHRFLSKFGRLIRLVFENSFEEFISLETELEQLKLYLDLEKARTDDKFTYRIELDPTVNAAQLMIPSMIIQPFLENAIWHGIMPSGKPGEIVISFRKDKESIECKVSDNGIGRERSSELKQQIRRLHNSKGIELTKERLGIYNTPFRKYQLDFVDLVSPAGEPEGTLVRIELPYKNA